MRNSLFHVQCLTLDAHILEYHDQGATRDMICSLLQVGPNRVSRVLNFFRDRYQLPPRVGKGRPKKVTRDILDFIDISTIQSPKQSLKALSDEIHSCFDTVLLRATIANVRHELKFHYQPAHHIQSLKPRQIEDRIAFCQEMLQRPVKFPLIHFSDESRFIIGADKQ
jgi:transposase